MNLIRRISSNEISKIVSDRFLKTIRFENASFEDLVDILNPN